MNNIKTVTIIGANGTLGKTISGIFASFGNAKVYMVARNLEKAKKAKEEAILSVKALSIGENLFPKSFDDMEECIKQSDLVFESVAEDYEVKENIHKKINNYVDSEIIVATGTSGLSIDELANYYSEEKRKNFLGIHFFNPPYSLTLCEVIPSIYNKGNRELIESVKEYLQNVLRRDVVEVKNEPAFLANRIGFYFMHEAVKSAVKYKDKGGIDYIDQILGCYTGRNMAPLQTINFVGLDVYKAIVENIHNKIDGNEKDIFKPVEFIDKLISEGKLGLKVKEGLYKHSDNKVLVYDIKNNYYRELKKYKFNFKEKTIEYFSTGDYQKGINEILHDNTDESKICVEFLLKYIIYAINTSKLVSRNIMDSDIAMATGFNWIPPSALIEAFGGTEKVEIMCKKYLIDDAQDIKILKDIRKSEYDYRKFLKARE